jgi:hypothetical protein
MTKEAIPPSQTGIKLLKLVDEGCGSANALADRLGVTQPRVSAIAGRLIKGGWLKKDGAKYATSKRAKALFFASNASPARSKNITALRAPAIASQVAPTKDRQATGQDGKSADNTPLSELDELLDRALLKAKPEFRAQAPVFVVEDWRDFLDLGSLPRKAGCSPGDLSRVVYKEAADNSCDAGANVSLSLWTDQKGNPGICLKDDGPGLEPEMVRQIYSANRPQVSSKRIRRVSRGLLGNGSRVIGGAVAASSGTLMVETCGLRLWLQMDMATGQMVMQSNEPIAFEPGLSLYLALGPALALKEYQLDLAQATIRLNRHGRVYSGPSSPWWYGQHDLFRLAQEAPAEMSFTLLCRACGFVISGIAEPSWQRPAKKLSKTEIQSALEILRARNKPIAPQRLGLIGPQAFAKSAYVKTHDVAFLDGAELPYVIEVWAKCSRSQQKAQGELTIDLLVNRSATPAKLHGFSAPDWLTVHGCGLRHYISATRITGDYAITLSVITPHLPLTNEGKEPVLEHLPILATIAKAARRAYQALDRPRRIEIKEAAWEIMEEAYGDASDDGALPANARQVMCAARPYILERTGLETFGDQYFTQKLLPDYLDEHPEQTENWDVVFDARGNAVEPHTSRKIALGTLAVRNYLEQIFEGAILPQIIDLPSLSLFPTIGPINRYKYALFVEKKGFGPLLQAGQIAEKYDLLIASTKGLSVTAVRKLFDKLCDYGLAKIFVLHDFDISGFSIFGTLGKSNRRYRFENRVEIVDLGLRLADVQAEQLQTEPIPLDKDPDKQRSKWAAQALTLARHGATSEEIEFLRTRRSELNMLTGRRFLTFLEQKLSAHGVTKYIPNEEILSLHLQRAREHRLAKELLDKHRLELKAKAAAMPMPGNLMQVVSDFLKEHPEQPWDKAMTEILALSCPETGL